jgi:hypothetical protein
MENMKKIEKAVSVPVVKKATKAPEKTAKAPEKNSEMAGTEPCMWTLNVGEGDQILAVYSLDGAEFRGTRKEFSAALRGE